MSMVGFPLLLIPLAIYNIFVFLMRGVEFTAPIVTLPLLSRVQWTLTFGDALLALAMVLLWLEIVKASRPGARFLTDHLLSLIVFGVALAEFLLLEKFATSTFFLLTVLTAVEFLSGVSIGLRHRRFRTQASARAPMAQEPERHEPAMEAAPPEDDRPQRSEPLKSRALKPEPAMDLPQEPKPPEMMTVSPAHEPAPEPASEPAKPVPSLAVVHAPAPPPAGGRTLSDWSIKDLVRDEPHSDQPPKS